MTRSAMTLTLLVLTIPSVIWSAPAQDDEVERTDKGIKATFLKKGALRFDLKGEAGIVYWKCTRCKKWHKEELLFVKSMSMKWEDGKKTKGWLYEVKKVDGKPRRYFVTDRSISGVYRAAISEGRDTKTWRRLNSSPTKKVKYGAEMEDLEVAEEEAEAAEDEAGDEAFEDDE